MLKMYLLILNDFKTLNVVYSYIDWMAFYAVSAIFQPCNDYKKNMLVKCASFIFSKFKLW